MAVKQVGMSMQEKERPGDGGNRYKDINQMSELKAFLSLKMECT